MAVESRNALLAGRYRVQRPRGSGGMATVFLCEDERLGRQVAVKRLHAHSPDDVARRFSREAKLGASLNHPNLVSVFDTLTDDEAVLIVMEYVEGETLHDALQRGPLPPKRALEVIRDVANALDHAHSHGVVHRDVKPANILLREDGVVKLVDLGIATAADVTRITQSGVVLGTASYMAPEQIEGRRVDARTDVYALGCVLFHAVTGAVPFPERESSAKMWAHLNEPPPPVGSGGGGRGALDPVICRAMAKDPADRFPSAGDLGRAALAATRGEAVTEPEHLVGIGEAAPAAETIPLPAATAPTERRPRRRRRRRLRRIVVSLLVLLVAAALAFGALIVVPRLTDSDNPTKRPNGITVPSLAGQPLDVAEQRLDDLGLGSTEEGGGIFGVLVPSDWEVCATTPSADSAVRPGSTVRLAIDRPGAC